MERSRVRAWHCLQHRLGSGGRWEGVLQQSQWPFVVQGCPETLFHNGSLELYHNGYRESQEVPLPLPGILGEPQLESPPGAEEGKPPAPCQQPAGPLPFFPLPSPFPQPFSGAAFTCPVRSAFTVGILGTVSSLYLERGSRHQAEKRTPFCFPRQPIPEDHSRNSRCCLRGKRFRSLLIVHMEGRLIFSALMMQYHFES